MDIFILIVIQKNKSQTLDLAVGSFKLVYERMVDI